MQDPEEYGVGSATSIAHKISLLRKQTGLLVTVATRLLEDAERQEHKAFGSALFFYTAAASESANSLILLAENDKFRDAYVTGRTVFLSLVNACFTCAEGKQAAERALRYSSQKLLRDQRRKIKVGDLEMSIEAYVPARIERDLELKAAIQEFTGRKGRERRSWTDENLEQQLGRIRAKYGRVVGGRLLLTLGLIYRPASEIAHGTVYGTAWSLGVNAPRLTCPPEKLRWRRQFNLDMLLYSICLCTCAAIEVIAKEFDSCAAFAIESNATGNELSSWITDIDRKLRGLHE
jgi:hypothetical protein